MHRRLLLVALLLGAPGVTGELFVGRPVAADEFAVQSGSDGKLQYRADELGNRIPDFSTCGYAGGDRDIPDVPAVVVVHAGEGDDETRIQAALDQTAALPLRENGFRGAVQLAPGEFQVAGQLVMNASGVVLRGAGATAEGTIVVARGSDRRTLIRVAGVDDRQPPAASSIRRVVDDYVPVGGTVLTLDSAAGLKVGDAIVLRRPSSVEWVKRLGADAFGVGWRPGSRDISWERTVVTVDGKRVTLDAPVTTAIEAKFGGATVESLQWSGRLKNVGVEDLVLASTFDKNNRAGEDHAWHAVVFENVVDAWLRRVKCRHFAGGAVAVWETGRCITIEDCLSLSPVSELGGRRRMAFFTQGQQTLFLRCWSAEGIHDFATGHCSAGPNAFVNCFAARTHGDSGPLESWTSGLLFDNVRIDGGRIAFENRWAAPAGCGWAAANCVAWQCQAAQVRCFKPPGANNWTIGVWANVAGDGLIEGIGDFAQPLSLFQAQLRERRGDAAARRIDPLLLDPVGSTNPTIAQAENFTRQSAEPPKQLIDVIRERMEAAVKSDVIQRSLTKDTAPSRSPIKSVDQQPQTKPLGVLNGWLMIGDRVATGRTLTPKWWAGNIRPAEAPAFGPAITRFVPGRVGSGFTDDLPALAARMNADGMVAYDHHYGLWYDRRRDEHTHVRQANGEVEPPFYEQPFARTGEGDAWDGLSRYDLTQFNPWYWNRLRDFAKECDDKGLVLLHQNYFQHNILEAGAHWADSPWRPANNVNGLLPFPEPPPYVGDKRIFLAETFYDVTNPQLRELHREYIRQCLFNVSDRTNVIQLTSGEYSGPLHFVEFWIDVISEWERETGRDALVAVSAPKNVQDAILSDLVRTEAVDVIDVRYWAYTADDGLYAPNGGENLAPRQHLRQTKLKPGGAAAIVRAVREYRERYPEKAVIYYADQNCPSAHDGWAVLIGGGSLADVPRLPAELAAALSAMKPDQTLELNANQWALSQPGSAYLIYSAASDEPLKLKLPDSDASYEVRWINATTGAVADGSDIRGGAAISLQPQEKIAWITRRE
ncbi:DUF6298 domain-containing protein [Lacipirellula parvula]|uniref:DUF6298 domain-containing protein n=1 Tax=Lacipirellula parvula TaxID=2650471 RepID=A0A5K7XDA2_9BACT|nr:DUF6298 domain-containing protein [Lacipirellula parvula]BBO34365.1 hypothetical protein PLANPX_3977 [Lacipirellula parvula]